MDNDVQTTYPVQPPHAHPPIANATNIHRPPPSWLFDTGASHHVTSDIGSLHTYLDYGEIESR